MAGPDMDEDSTDRITEMGLYSQYRDGPENGTEGRHS